MVLAAINSSVGLIGWLIIGGLAGALAGRVMSGHGFGIVGDIVVGCIGGLVGGWTLGLFVSADVGLIGTFITAFIGACILLFVVHALTGGRRGRLACWRGSAARAAALGTWEMEYDRRYVRAECELAGPPARGVLPSYLACGQRLV